MNVSIASAALSAESSVEILYFQVDDKKDLEYAGGGEENEQEDQRPEDGKTAEKQLPDQGGDAQEDENDDHINEDTEDKYEDRQFAAPQVNSLPLPSFVG